MNDDLFVGIYPAGILYAHRTIKESGDYKHLAFLSYTSLKLKFYPGCPRAIRPRIEADAQEYINRRGEALALDACGHSITLGEK